MASPFLGMINMFGQSWAPVHYALAQGQFMAIAQNQALFSLFGTQFGGNGRTNFCLPDLRGRTPVGDGTGDFSDSYKVGTQAGLETVVLSNANMPSHRHLIEVVDESADQLLTDNNRTFADIKTVSSALVDSPGYNNSNTSVAMSTNALPTVAGSGQAHNNMQPSIVINFSVALQGVFPSRN